MKEVLTKTALWFIALYLFTKTAFYILELGGHPVLAIAFFGVASIAIYFTLFYEEETK